MKLLRSSKYLLQTLLKNHKQLRYRDSTGVKYYRRLWSYLSLWGVQALVIIIFVGLVFFSERTFEPRNSTGGKEQNSSTLTTLSTTISPKTLVPSAGLGTTSISSLSFSHNAIKTTKFWVGEQADSSNGFIANSASAWDEQWQSHYGGVDSPNNRNSYFPGFAAKENPFYVALPYNDFSSSGKRKANASFCPNVNNPSLVSYSWCKNAWVAVRHSNKVVYAQWEDVGPFEEDDFAYVFGNAAPKNRDGEKAGLDVSPAISGYLGLSGSDSCDWSFVDFKNVPQGPWKQIITTSKGESL